MAEHIPADTRPRGDRRADPGEVFATLRRIFADSGREYRWHYLFAAVCLLAIAATTAFTVAGCHQLMSGYSNHASTDYRSPSPNTHPVI